MDLYAYAIYNNGNLMTEYPYNQLSAFVKEETANFILDDVKKQYPDAKIVRIKISVCGESNIEGLCG